MPVHAGPMLKGAIGVTHVIPSFFRALSNG